MYDVVIVGGGPAGATLGQCLDKNLRVLIIEKREMNQMNRMNRVEMNQNSSLDFAERNSREKCCGGLIAPDAQAMLARLGLGIPKEVLVGPQIFTVRTMDFDNDIERFYIRNYINIDRELFDQWMINLVPDNVSVFKGAIYKGYEEIEDGVLIKYFFDGVEYTVKSKILIGADGAASSIRKSIVGEENNRYVSIQEWYETDNSSPYFSSVFDSEITDFYCWTIPKDNHLIIGAAIKERDDVNAKFDLFKKKLRSKGFILDKFIKRSGAFILRPKSLNQICMGKGNVFLVGEAAGFISPSSAEGISYAMKSGMILAEAINESNGRVESFETSGIEAIKIRKNYNSKVKSIKRNIILKNIKIPAMYNRTLRGFIMKIGIFSCDIIT